MSRYELISYKWHEAFWTSSSSWPEYELITNPMYFTAGCTCAQLTCNEADNPTRGLDLRSKKARTRAGTRHGRAYPLQVNKDRLVVAFACTSALVTTVHD